MKTAKIHTTFLLALACAVMLSSCANLEKMVDSGDYESAIAFSVKKLRGKTKKKVKYVRALETAFNKANDRDVRKIKNLKEKGDLRSWESIYSITERIDRRQRLVEPLLPVIDQEGYQAEFKFVKVAGLQQESSEYIADQYYDEGLHLLNMGEKGDKQAARDAYKTFDKIERYFTNYRNSYELMKQAHQLGTIHMKFRLENNSREVLPVGSRKSLSLMAAAI